MNFDSLTDEQKARARACKTPEEILELAKEVGYELSDEELESVVGGVSLLDGWNFIELLGAQIDSCRDYQELVNNMPASR